MNKTLLALYGLKWNPFSPELPAEALQTSARVDNFCWRVEHTLAREGGFALSRVTPVQGKVSPCACWPGVWANCAT
jgi:general secretion pathway protein A